MRSLEIIALEFFTWFWVLQAACGAWKAHTTRRLGARARKHDLPQSAAPPPARVALVVPARGVRPSFERFLDLILDQSHPDYRLLFVTDSPDDPAREALRRRLDLAPCEEQWVRPSHLQGGPATVTLVVAGHATDCGQKVHNQLAAFRLLEPEDRVVAFADTDIVGHNDWLRRLSSPLDAGLAEVTTGYRWIVPASASLPNVIATGINATVAAFFGPRSRTRPWGGSIAMTRAAFDEIDVPGVIAGCLCEDSPIGAALHSKGKPVRFVRTLVMPTPADYTWASFFAFARRQYLIIRLYLPGIWWTAAISITLYLSGFTIAWTRLLRGEAFALIPIVLAFLLNVLRTRIRGRYIHEQFEPGVVEKLEPVLRRELFTTTLNYLLHFAIILASAFAREVSWAGTRYRVQGKRSVTVLASPSPPLSES